MIVERIGTVKEYLDGTLDLMDWVVDDVAGGSKEFPLPSEAEEQELIAIAKKNGTYTYCFLP